MTGSQVSNDECCRRSLIIKRKLLLYYELDTAWMVYYFQSADFIQPHTVNILIVNYILIFSIIPISQFIKALGFISVLHTQKNTREEELQVFFLSHPFVHCEFLVSILTNGLCLHQFLETKTTDANKSLKTDAN